MRGHFCDSGILTWRYCIGDHEPRAIEMEASSLHYDKLKLAISETQKLERIISEIRDCVRASPA